MSVCKTKHWMRLVIFLLLVIIFELYVIGTENCIQDNKYNGTLPVPTKLHGVDDEPCIIPKDEVLATLNETEMVTIYWRFVTTIQIHCRNQARFGSHRGAGKELCLDESFKPKQPCLLYSFGSNFQFSFEIRVNEHLGCEIYTFDPSMDIKDSNQNKTIPPIIQFKEVGLADKDYIAPNSWQMKTLKTIMGDLRHNDKIIDLLKIDIEGNEWEAIPEIVESGVYERVKQLLIEVHFGHRFAIANVPFWGNRTMVEQLRALRMLYECGFRIFMRERLANYFYEVHASSNNKIPSQIELSFVNIAFLHKLG